MPRFTLRPSKLLRRLSSKHSTTHPDSTNNSDDGTDAPAATSASPSPSPNRNASTRRPRKSSSVARLRDKLRSQDGSASQTAPFQPRKSSLPAVRQAFEEKKPKRSATTPPASREGQRSNKETKPSSAASRARASDTDTAEELDLLPDADAELPPLTESALADHHLQRNLDDESEQTPPELSLDVDGLPLNPRLVLQEATPEALGGRQYNPE